jgi:hypothetical protein
MQDLGRQERRICRMRTVMILLVFTVGSALAQTENFASNGTTHQMAQSAIAPNALIWQIPFASTGNIISLAIQNNSSVEAKNVSVTFNNVPLLPSAPSSRWLKFKSTTVLIKSIAANASGDAEFVFSVDKKAPVGKDTTLTATITTSDGQVWTKGIKIAVAAPKEYKLYNNYPNPFNPSTKIAFELPKASRVKLIIYDIVGREVAQVADADYPAGYTELTWNGLNSHGTMVSSGVYFYRLVVSSAFDGVASGEPISSDNWSKVKKMMVVK